MASEKNRNWKRCSKKRSKKAEKKEKTLLTRVKMRDMIHEVVKDNTYRKVEYPLSPYREKAARVHN